MQDRDNRGKEIDDITTSIERMAKRMKATFVVDEEKLQAFKESFLKEYDEGHEEACEPLNAYTGLMRNT